MHKMGLDRAKCIDTVETSILRRICDGRQHGLRAEGEFEMAAQNRMPKSAKVSTESAHDSATTTARLDTAQFIGIDGHVYQWRHVCRRDVLVRIS